MPRIIRDDGARLEYEIRPAVNSGPNAFIFQHGMGGDRHQPLGYLHSPAPVNTYAMDARGHGDSSDIVGSTRCSFDSYADDVIALADHVALDTFILGGISMGAAVALNAALRHPERIAALVLCRPAWLETPQAELNQSLYAQIADLLDHEDTTDALAALTTSAGYAEVAAASANAAQSLRHQVNRPRAAVNADILRRLPTTSPAPDLTAWAGIDVPTLVIGHRADPFHPWQIAETTANRMPRARLVEVTSKDRDAERFAAEIDTAIHDFLTELAAA